MEQKGAKEAKKEQEITEETERVKGAAAKTGG